MSVYERVKEQQELRNTEGDAERERLSQERALLERLRRDLIDYLGLSAVSALVAEGDPERARAELSVSLHAVLNTKSYEQVAQDDRARLIGEVLDGILGLGPLQPLLDDDEITEVMVNGCQSLYYEKEGKLHPAARVFDSEEQILMVVDRILAPLGRRLDEASPIVNARLANGYRVNAVIKPVAIDGPDITIRKFSGQITSLDRLVELGSLPEWFAQLLRWAVQARMDIAVAGGTGSGKTTLLNALSSEIGESERIITIEDSAELKFDGRDHVVRLEAREASIEGVGEVTIRMLVTNALRMRPDRIVVGEVRGEECIDMLQAMNTGHDGSLTTLHAGTAQEAILRLIYMARTGMNLPAELIEEQVAMAIDLIVMSRRIRGGARVISELCGVARSPEGKAVLEPLVTYDLHTKDWRLVGEPAFLADAVNEGILDGEEVRRWRRHCG